MIGRDVEQHYTADSDTVKSSERAQRFEEPPSNTAEAQTALRCRSTNTLPIFMIFGAVSSNRPGQHTDVLG